MSDLTNKKQTVDDSDSEDDDVDLFAPSKRCLPVIGRLPCGDLHVCRVGKSCPFLEANDDRIMVCTLTGLEHGPEQTDEYYDLNGGTGKKSGDPDQSCGELLHGKWARRADPTHASRMAFELANQICDEDVFQCAPDASGASACKRQTKRGALCVGEVEEEKLSKRSRSSKKNVDNFDTRSHLHAEAESVITKMINYQRTSSFKQKAVSGKIERKCAPFDPRLCDEKFVYTKTLQRYVKNCIVSNSAPSLDAIHNLCLMAKEVSAKARLEQKKSESVDGIRTAKFRGLCSSLIVSLWSAICSTPYMANARRGTDAYRPFICGVLYGFKRGIKLDSGKVLVPQCQQLSDALPVLRGTGGNTLAKTLHSSSHRGLCTLSRCIASVPKTQQAEVFSNVIRIASQFANTTFTKHDI